MKSIHFLDPGPAMNLGILALTLPLMASYPPVPGPIPAAFTHIRVLAPEGSRTTWYPGTSWAVSTRNVDPVALRPGYCYRFELANIGERKKDVIWPSIEVRGTLIPQPQMNVADHPIRIVFTEDDIERILEGRFITRFYYLEDPHRAINGTQLPGIPIEINTPNEAEALKEARSRGRLLIIVRAGERLWTPDELVRENVPGTIWLPKTMNGFPVPALPPALVHGGIPLFDPLSGPDCPTGECLFDGGDRNLNLGIGKENRLFGLDPSDTAIEYKTSSGKKVATSNRVCICIPRYAATRVEMVSLAHDAIRGPEIKLQTDTQQMLTHRLPPLSVAQLDQPIDATGQIKANAFIKEIGPLTKEMRLGRPVAIANMNGTKVVSELVEVDDLTVYPDCTLVLFKRMDPPNPKRIGEVVTFYLRYRNPSLQPMTEVVVSDSLTGRLEYIEGSAKSDRAATFTSSPNEAGSVVLRWSIDGKLLPGMSGTISFQARIR
ncbi:MAG: DUF11 domain-containing protein [Planctomycetes bacterium]|nr:DUF11 domain-containing protein [Planctomycetota bacterium]